MSVCVKGDDCVDSGIINELTIQVDYSLDSLVELYGSLFVLKRSNEIDFASAIRKSELAVCSFWFPFRFCRHE